MGKFCGKCGSMLDQQTGKCPVCDRVVQQPAVAPSKKPKVLVIALVIILVVALAVGSTFAAMYFLNKPEPEVKKETTTTATQAVKEAEKTEQADNSDKYVIGNKFVKTDSVYIYTDNEKLYSKSKITDEGKVIAEIKNNGQIMAGPDFVYLSDSKSAKPELSYTAYDDSFTIYSVDMKSKAIKKLFSSVGAARLLTEYKGSIYYIDLRSYDDVSLCKYDIASDSIEDVSSVLSIKSGEYIQDAVYTRARIYLHLHNEDKNNADRLVEYNLINGKASVVDQGKRISIYKRHTKSTFAYVSYTMSDNIYRASDMYIHTLNKDYTFASSEKMESILDQPPEIISSDGKFALFMTSGNSEDFDLYKVDVTSGDVTVYEGAAGRFKNKGYGVSVDLANPENIYFCGASPMRFTDDGFAECECEKILGYEFYWIADGYVIDSDFKNYKLTEKAVKKAAEKETTAPKSEKSKTGYEDIIEAYIDTYPWGMQFKIDNFSLSGELHSMYDLNTLGYAYKDLDGNGTDELLVGPVGKEGAVLDVYTIVNGKVVQLTTSWSRSQNMITDDWSIMNSGSGGACLSIWELKVIGSDKSSLKVKQRVTLDGFHAEEVGLISDAFESPELAWFKSSSDSKEDYVNISQDEAMDIIDGWESSYADIKYTPLSQYK